MRLLFPEQVKPVMHGIVNSLADVSRPLFIPLKKSYFLAFEDGSKSEEFRLYGPRWNERTCFVGRRVILSLGYSGRRLEGVISSFRQDSSICQSAAWVDCYGPASRDTVAACIGVKLDQPAATKL